MAGGLRGPVRSRSRFLARNGGAADCSQLWSVLFTPWPGNDMLDLATSSAVLGQAPPAFLPAPRPEPSVSMHTQGA
eukprot:1935801-Prymnesium_polylepis.1